VPVSVRQICKFHHGGRPCIKIYGPDMVTVTATYDCKTWCPLLKRVIDDEEPTPTPQKPSHPHRRG
jgi:hypothetical protein